MINLGFIKDILEFIFHVDRHLDSIIHNFGIWSYLVLFLVVFAETGLVVTPLLPGDSFLFAAGTFAALGSFNIFWLFIVLFAAAVTGDSVNYAIGKILGVKVFKREDSRIFKKEYLERTHRFYEKYGGKTIVLARFMPIVRTFAPFVAGVGKMNYAYFITYNVIGGFMWVSIFVLGGFYFGSAPLIKNNFSIAIIAIIFLSILPAVIEILRHRKKKGNSA